MTNLDKVTDQKNKHATFGEKGLLPILLFTCYSLQIKFLQFIGKKASQKDDKVNNKTGYKLKAKGKRREREKKTEIDSLLSYFQLAENYVLSVGNIFFSNSRANWPKHG